MKHCVKRFLLPLGLLVLGICLHFAARALPGSAGAMNALVLFGILPLLVLSLIWAAWRAIWSLYWVYVEEQPWPRRRNVMGRFKLENRSIAAEWLDLSLPQKLLYILLRAGGDVAMVAAVVYILRVRNAWGTVILLGGLALRFLASPERYNLLAGGWTTVSCQPSDTIGRLYRALRGVLTELGTPYVATVRFVEGNCLVLGPDDDGRFICVRRGRTGKRLRVSLAPSDYLILEEKTIPLRGPEDYGEDLPHVGNRVLKKSFAEMIRRYLQNGEVRLEFPAPKETGKKETDKASES